MHNFTRAQLARRSALPAAPSAPAVTQQPPPGRPLRYGRYITAPPAPASPPPSAAVSHPLASRRSGGGSRGPRGPARPSPAAASLRARRAPGTGLSPPSWWRRGRAGRPRGSSRCRAARLLRMLPLLPPPPCAAAASSPPLAAAVTQPHRFRVRLRRPALIFAYLKRRGPGTRASGPGTALRNERLRVSRSGERLDTVPRPLPARCHGCRYQLPVGRRRLAACGGREA